MTMKIMMIPEIGKDKEEIKAAVTVMRKMMITAIQVVLIQEEVSEV